MIEVTCPRCHSPGIESESTASQAFDCGMIRNGRDGKLEDNSNDGRACAIIADLRETLRRTRSGHAVSPIRTGAVASAGLANTYKRMWQNAVESNHRTTELLWAAHREIRALTKPTVEL